MKKLYALLVVAFSVSSLAVAAPNTHSVGPRQGVDSNEKVVPSMTSPAIEVFDFSAPSWLANPVAVLADVRPPAVVATKVAALVNRKDAYRAPVVEAWLICAASSPPTAPPGPDNPAKVSFVQIMARPAWHMPADDNPGAIEGREGGRQEGSLV